MHLNLFHFDGITIIQFCHHSPAKDIMDVFRTYRGDSYLKQLGQTRNGVI